MVCEIILILYTNRVDIASIWVVGDRHRRGVQVHLLLRHRHLRGADSNSTGSNDERRSAERRAPLGL